MLPAAMKVPALRPLLLSLLVPVALLASGCGETGVEVAKTDPLRAGAEVFNQRCAGCHTYAAAGAEGSATKIKTAEKKDGPNFDARKEDYEDVLYAIQNGGFSSGPMPQNIVSGEEAKLVACFVATFSGTERDDAPDPTDQTNTSSSSGDCRDELNANP